MKQLIITDSSVWLVETFWDDSTNVVARASFGSPYLDIPGEPPRQFNGPVTRGEVRVGSRLHFTDIATNSEVMTGIINRVVAFEDQPEREVPEGFIDLTPSWEAIAFVNRESAQQAGKQADRLVSLWNMGRINDDDIRAADARTKERFR